MLVTPVFAGIEDFCYVINKQPINIFTGGGNTTTEVQSVAVGGEVSGTVGNIILSNTALNDQYCRLDNTTINTVLENDPNDYDSLSDLQSSVSNDFHNLGGTDLDTGNTSSQIISTINTTDYYQFQCRNASQVYNSSYLTTEVDSLWSANYSALNNSWSTTYNVTYDSISATYNASTITTVYGTLDTGNLASVQVINDNDYYNVSEDLGVNPLQININFTGVTSFDNIIMREQYTGVLGHEINMEVYNFNTENWDSFSVLTDQGNFVVSVTPIISSVNYVSGDVVSMRLRHIQSGMNTHDFYIDYIALLKGFTTITNAEHDSLSGRDSVSNHPWALPKTTAAATYVNVSWVDCASGQYAYGVSGSSGTLKCLADQTGNTSAEILSTVNVTDSYYNIISQKCYYISNTTERNLFLSTYNVTYESTYNSSYLTGEVDPVYSAWDKDYADLTNKPYYINNTYNQSYESTYNSTYDTKPSNTYNVSYDAQLNHNTSAEILAIAVSRLDWTTHDSYPNGCSAGQYISTIGDTLTCSVPSTYNSSYMTSTYNSTYDANIDTANTTAQMISAVNITSYYQFQCRNASQVVNTTYESTYNSTYDAKPSNTYNISYDAQLGHNTTAEMIAALNITSYYQFQCRNASQVVNTTYESTYNSSYMTNTYNSTYDANIDTANTSAQMITAVNITSYFQIQAKNSSQVYNSTYDAQSGHNTSAEIQAVVNTTAYSLFNSTVGGKFYMPNSTICWNPYCTVNMTFNGTNVIIYG